MKTPDKIIMRWMQVSPRTFYRWRSAGLIKRRPTSEAEARQLVRQIEAAQDLAGDRRQVRGRPGLAEIAARMGEGERA